MPWVHSISSSSVTGCCASRACSVATSGHSTTSPSRPGAVPCSSARSARSLPGGGGLSSSMGKARTSVGPGSPIQRWCRSAMVRLVHQQNGQLRQRVDAHGVEHVPGQCGQAGLVHRDPRLVGDLDAHPLAPFAAPGRVTGRRRSLGTGADATGGTRRAPALALRAVAHAVPAPVARHPLRPPRGPPGARVVGLVGVDDVADQPVPDHVVAVQPGEVDVVDAVEDLLDELQAARPGRPAGPPG